MIVLIDADLVVYRCATVNEYSIDWGEASTSTIVESPSYAFDCAMNTIESILKNLNSKKYLLCFTGRNNFRYKVYPAYKANRKHLKMPELYPVLMSLLQEECECRIKDGLEADDVMGILATKNRGRYTIATLDKDLQQIPAPIYNWKTKELVTVSDREADFYFYRQILTGDPVDNYVGLKGCGVVRATKFLNEIIHEDQETIWQKIVELFESKGYSEEFALTQARVARILRAEDYDFKNKKPILWTPKKEVKC